MSNILSEEVQELALAYLEAHKRRGIDIDDLIGHQWDRAEIGVMEPIIKVLLEISKEIYEADMRSLYAEFTRWDY